MELVFKNRALLNGEMFAFSAYSIHVSYVEIKIRANWRKASVKKLPMSNYCVAVSAWYGHADSALTLLLLFEKN